MHDEDPHDDMTQSQAQAQAQAQAQYGTKSFLAPGSVGSSGSNSNSHSDGRTKHSRSINSESTELLTLHSDMRCFVMDETPISAFCNSLLESQQQAQHSPGSKSKTPLPDEEEATATAASSSSSSSSNVYIPHQAGRSDIEHGMSYLRQQFIYMYKKSVSYCFFWVIVVVVVSVVRLALVRLLGGRESVTSTLGLVSFCALWYLEILVS